MTDEELCKDARSAAKCLKDTGTFPTGQGIFLDCADRIEALTKERELFEESWVYAADKLAKAMSIAKRVTSFEDTTEELAQCGCDRCKAHLDLRALLAEIEGKT
jgi:DNA-binding SARP family transcriptional activator